MLSKPPVWIPTKAPSTWPEVALAAAKLKASGHKCPLTTSWISWTQLESFSAWHNTLFATKGNGLQGMDARMNSTRRCTCAISKIWPTWPSKACLSTKVGAMCLKPASFPVNAP
jgi:hypothetical protein